MPDRLLQAASTTVAADTAGDQSAGTQQPAAAPPGYELLEKVGAGGMGVVFRAREIAFDRDVAVKFLQERFAADSPAARRFLDEARITGQLQHPAIPPVHHIGTLPSGRPYLAMKLIRGETLADLLRDSRDPSDRSANLIPVFAQVCQAVAYAHARGVIHRDLKPANVMVGAFGEVQVMDWGLAKVLGSTPAPVSKTAVTEVKPRGAEETRLSSDTNPAQPAEAGTAEETRPWREAGPVLGSDALYTEAGSLVGTPAYIAPEQAAGELDKVDERADVFGLGAILAVILTGKPPYVGDTTDTVRMKAVRGELADCLARLDVCAADPELVVLCRRCLSFAPTDRPRDAGAVAKAVAAHLAAAEERARQAELERVRAQEQRKRRRVQLSLAAALILLLAGAGAFAWWQDRQAYDRRLAEADRETKEARLVAERDAEARVKAEQAQLGVEANLKLAADLRRQYKFTTAGTALAQAAELARSGVPLRLPEVEQARRDLAFVVQLDDIRFRKWEWGAHPNSRARDSKRTASGRFTSQTAPPAYRVAFAARGLDLTALESAEATRRIAASAVKAELVAAVDDWALYEPDVELRDRLLAIARDADPDSWRDRLRDPRAWSDPGAISHLAAEVNFKENAPATFATLAELLRRCNLGPAALLVRARVVYPEDFELAFALGHFEAMTKGGQPIGPYEAARARRPDNPVVWNNLGSMFVDNRSWDTAIATLQRALELDPKFAIAHYNLGVALQGKGDLKGAIAAYQRSNELDGSDPVVHYNLGLALSEKGNPDGALAAYKQALELDPEFAQAHSNLGFLLLAREDVNGALAAFDRALQFDPRDALAHFNRGNALRIKGDMNGAIAAYKRAAELNTKDAQAPSNLGGVYLAIGKYPDAIAAARKAIEADPSASRAHVILGLAHQQMGDIAAARAALTEAARLDQQWAPLLAKLPPNPPPREKNKTTLEWRNHWTEALREARVKKQPMLLVVSFPTCKWWLRMERTTFTDPRVRALISAMIPVLLNGEDDGRLFEQLKVSECPLIAVFDPTGREVARVHGLQEPGAFLEWLKRHGADHVRDKGR